MWRYSQRRVQSGPALLLVSGIRVCFRSILLFLVSNSQWMSQLDHAFYIRSGLPREHRGTRKKFSHAQSMQKFSTKLITHHKLTCLHMSMSLSTLTVKALLIILPKRSLTESRQCQERKKQCEDAAHEGENKGNKSLMGPLKSLGDPGKYPLSTPSRWACIWS